MQKIFIILTIFPWMLSASLTEAQRIDVLNYSRTSNGKLAAVAPEQPIGNTANKTEPTGIPAVKSHPALSKTPTTADLAHAELTHPRNHVLLIGVNDYIESPPSTVTRLSVSLDDLNFCVNDMHGLQEALVKARFCRAEDIQILVSGAGGKNEPTSDNVYQALNNLEKNIKEGDRVLVAFSGHGVSLPLDGHLDGQDKTEDFLCCADAEVIYNAGAGRFTTKNGLISRSKDIEERLDNTKAGTKLIFIDACRNVLDEFTGLLKGSEGESKGLANTRSAMSTFGRGIDGNVKGEGMFRFSSCKPTETSQEYPDITHGVFTYYLIQGMLGAADGQKSGIITLDDLSKYVSKETREFVESRWTQANPVTQSPMLVPVPQEAGYAYDVKFSYCNSVEEETPTEFISTSQPLPTLDHTVQQQDLLVPQQDKEQQEELIQIQSDGEEQAAQQRQQDLLAEQQEKERQEELARIQRDREEQVAQQRQRDLLAEQQKKEDQRLRTEWDKITRQYTALNSFENSTQSKVPRSEALQRERSRIISEIRQFNQAPRGILTQSQVNEREALGRRLAKRISDWNEQTTVKPAPRPSNDSGSNRNVPATRSRSGSRGSSGGRGGSGVRI